MSQQTTHNRNAEHVSHFIDTVWNQRRLDALATCLTEDYIDHAYQPSNQAGLLAMVNELGAAFSDARQSIEAVTAQDDMVVCRMQLEATHDGPFRQAPASGKRVRVALYRSFRLREGRIAEHWALLDTASLLRQIGAVPSGENACKRD